MVIPQFLFAEKKKDVCDHCIRFKGVIDNPLTPVSKKEIAIKELEMHLDAAIVQRRAIKAFIQKY